MYKYYAKLWKQGIQSPFSAMHARYSNIANFLRCCKRYEAEKLKDSCIINGNMLGPPNYRSQATKPQAMLMQENILQSCNKYTLLQKQPYHNQATQALLFVFYVLLQSN